MLSQTSKRKPFKKELTWEEKNPVSYVFCPSEVFEELEKRQGTRKTGGRRQR